MHRDSSTHTTPDGKTYTRHLLRESYRSGGKVLKRTLANLSHLEPERLEALPLALAHKGPLCELANVSVEVELRQGAIESLLKRGVLQLGLFDQALAEVTDESGRRYVLDRNPVQAEVCATRRADPLATWQGQMAKTNTLDACYALVTDLTAGQASNLDYSRSDRFEPGGARFEFTLQRVFEDKLKLELKRVTTCQTARTGRLVSNPG